jgi:hypothetical protein
MDCGGEKESSISSISHSLTHALSTPPLSLHCRNDGEEEVKNLNNATEMMVKKKRRI